MNNQRSNTFLDNTNLPLEAMGLLSYLLNCSENGGVVKNVSERLKPIKNPDKQINDSLAILLNHEYAYWYKITDTKNDEILETGLIVFPMQTIYLSALIFAKENISFFQFPPNNPPPAVLTPYTPPIGGLRVKNNTGIGRNKKESFVRINISSYLHTETGSDKDLFISKCVHRWNTNKCTRKHKIDKKSGTYKRISKHISQLLAGVFFETNSLDKNFHIGVPQQWKTKKWSTDEILRGIHRLSLLMVEGYEFRGKETMNSLDKLLYNPGTNKSWFIHVMQNPPRQMKDIVQGGEKNPVIVKLLCDGLDATTAMQSSIQNIANDLVEWHTKHKINNVFLYHYPTPKKFVMELIEWLRDQDWIENPTIYHAQITSKTFVMFVDEIRRDIEF